MKNALITLLLLGLFIQATAQSRADQADILQQCLDLPTLQPYFPQDGTGGLRRLCIAQEKTIFPDNLLVAKDGKFPAYLTTAQVDGGEVSAYFLFKEFEINASLATVNFIYKYNETDKLLVVMEFQKSGEDWKVIKSRIEKDSQSF